MTDSDNQKEQKDRPSVRPDKPLEDENDDRLDRRHFAAAVARLIEGRSDRTSVVLAIYAPWGDGKTTVLNWIRHRLDGPKSDVIVVRFNPWLIRDELALLPAFFATISEALGKRLGGRKEQIAGVLQRYGKVVSGLTIGVPGVSFDPGATIAKLGEAMDGKTIDEMREEFETILRDEGKRLLVVIDDVDRLDDDETHAVFKLVKLAADFEGITYLMAFDDERVAAALAKRYSNGKRRGATGASDTGGFEFLEKIVQAPLRLPKARKRAIDEIVLEGLQQAITDASIEMSEQDAAEFRTRFAQGLSPAINSVRSANRYVSTASFALSLLRGEANATDILTVEGLNACYPSVYAAIREHPSWFLLPYEFHLSSQDQEVKQRRLDRLETIVSTVDPEERDAVRTLLRRLFPQTESVWSNVIHADGSEEWAEQQRVCSAEYFDRYFCYGVAASEIGDEELDTILTTPSEYSTEIAQLLARKGVQAVRPLLDKLDRRLDQLSPAQLVHLARAVLLLGPIVASDDEPRFLARNLLEECAAFIARLLMSLPEGEVRAELAEQIVATAHPLTFGAECLRYMRIKRSDSDQVRAVDDETAKSLAALLGQRIADYVEGLDKPLWDDRGGFGLMYMAARGDAGDRMKAHTKKWLDTDPNNVRSLLENAAGRLYGADGHVEQNDLTTDRYDALDVIADMNDLSTAVRSLRDDAEAPSDFPVFRYLAIGRQPTDRVILDQFAWQEARAAERKSKTDSTSESADGELPDGG